MSKKIFFTAAALITISAAASAQTNFQTFYDFGRKHVTTTLEGFHADNWGSTFFFIDYDYNNRDADGTVVSPSGSYFEIARALNFWQDSQFAPLSLHLEYNGGLGTGGNMGYCYPVNSAFLAGVDYFLHTPDYKNTLTLQLMFKQFVNLSSDVPLQLTVVWGCQDIFTLPGLRFSGFFDVWCEGSKAVMLSEPQLWYQVFDHFNIGGEVEFSYNFAGMEGFQVMPCLGTKWVF